MAKYPDLVTTKKGLDLNSAANAAQKAVIFTKVIVGDGDVPSDTSIGDLTAVVSPKMTLEITNKENLGNGHFTIRATLGNEELESGFYAKEIGVYAKLDGDVEVLYAYTNGGNYVDYIPDRSSPIDAQVFNIDVIIGNLQQATIVISDETHVTVQDLEAHNTSDNAHENRFSLFQKIATLGDDIIKKLALTTTITVINALQTNSWFGQLLQMVLNASGVKYSMAQNGYICLGSFFGGLIIQWGLQNILIDAMPHPISLPITPNKIYVSYLTPNSYDINTCLISAYVITNNVSLEAVIDYEIGQVISPQGTYCNIFYLSICR